jgi:hypothetical protein
MRIVPLLLIALLAAPGMKAQAPGAWKVFAAEGFSVAYPPALFTRCEASTLPRLTQQENGENIPCDVGPARVRFTFQADQVTTLRMTRDPLALQGQITWVPLQDATVAEFATAYPDLVKSTMELRAFLGKRPLRLAPGQDIPDLNAIDAGQSIHAHLTYVDTPYCSGVLFITQYTQDSVAIDGRRLMVVFQGLSKDGKHYLTAALPIGHRALLRPSRWSEKDIDRKYHAYLRDIEGTLRKIDYSPSLSTYVSMIRSLRARP